MKFVEIHELPESSPLTRQYHKVRTVKSMAGYDVVFLCQSPLKIASHYDTRTSRTTACSGPENGCHLCKANLLIRPKIYAPAMERVSNDQFVQEITESAYRDLLELIGKETSWRGLGVHLFRVAKHPNAKMGVKILGRRAEATLPPEFDPRPHLERLFDGMGQPRRPAQQPQKQPPQDHETEGL